MSRKKIMGYFVFLTVLIGMGSFYWGYDPTDSDFSAEDGVIRIEFKSLSD